MIRRPPRSTLFPYHDALPICRVRGGGLPVRVAGPARAGGEAAGRAERRATPAEHGAPQPLLPAAGERSPPPAPVAAAQGARGDRKSTRLNSSHANISYAVFCL